VSKRWLAGCVCKIIGMGVMKGKCKIKYRTYAAALEAMFRLLERPELGSVHECLRCDAFHISSRRFALIKKRGRGGARRGLVRFGT
jgi:hypothetical protein